ncbi:unnamed protein product [Polarella glacialis]|uniref:Pentatricopeptide repeat-containing protein n=1 Tax=Polarella glacialis TaxID=89957 RepID=A0A813LMD5_POLGL|nr:unnamed protein product [Polarella glacialis]CAE8733524.1 unnamed protein product [Polarella glacialis]
MVSEDTTEMVIMVFRILLPILIFFITFGHKIEMWISSWGPKHGRDPLLRHWQATRGCEKPEALATLRMVTADMAPDLFQKPEPSQNERPRREGKVGETRKGKRHPGEDLAVPVQQVHGQGSEEHLAADRMSVQNAVIEATDDERRQLQRLVNFMAFTRQLPQRVFLPEGDPPPPARPQEQPARRRHLGKESSTSRSAELANKEAQMVLHGALRQTNGSAEAHVAKGLYAHLSDVELHKETYTLMVEACVKVNDLQTASDFLIKMEAAGFVLEHDLLDKVMEVYWVHKNEKPESQQVSPPSLRSQKQLQPHQADAAELAGRHAGWAPIPVAPMGSMLPPPRPQPPLQAATIQSGGSIDLALPAFSVPAEFATAKASPVSSLSAGAAVFAPADSTEASLSSMGRGDDVGEHAQRFNFSSKAAVFKPGSNEG